LVIQLPARLLLIKPAAIRGRGGRITCSQVRCNRPWKLPLEQTANLFLTRSQGPEGYSGVGGEGTLFAGSLRYLQDKRSRAGFKKWRPSSAQTGSRFLSLLGVPFYIRAVNSLPLPARNSSAATKAPHVSPAIFSIRIILRCPDPPGRRDRYRLDCIWLWVANWPGHHEMIASRQANAE